ncbi:hypothetical protein FALBO_5936 [Fusarium albosuccineum]|uniref:FAD-binding domain-containing protein n=1 Tax=Fusarium albosuccineum TaxID=1237068 RepID=A0A8H4PK82_9HYPO|nr:hypothetical protein FALBO_5936 [Fusarium albosuccineum]
MANFKAIIIGAGPNGLLAALTLQKAGVDFIILEKRKVADLNWGSSVCVWPHSVRVLDQLGLLKEAKQLYMPIKRKCNLRRDGSVISWSRMIEDIKDFHGHDWMLFERGNLVNMLMKHLSDKSTQLMLDKTVTDINSGPDSVQVTCSDGSSYSGSILIGADGINSTARSFIDGADTDSADEKDSYAKDTFLTTFYGVYGHGGALSPTLEDRAVYETHSDGFSTQLIVASPEKHYFLIYQKLPTPTRKAHWLASEKAEELATQNADTYLAPGVTYKQVWEGKSWTHMAPLEEGVTKTWFKDRVVLLGDSAHKMTPNLGFSLNTGWQSAVTLTNLLRALLAEKPNPTNNDLTELFTKYDNLRRGIVKKDLELSATATRVQAWDTLPWKVIDQYILPYVGGDRALLKYLCSPLVKKSITLDFLPEHNFTQGKIRWVNKPADHEEADMDVL